MMNTDGAELPRVWMDFQNIDAKDRVVLSPCVAEADLARQRIVLDEGTRLILYYHEFEAEGIATHSADWGWVAVVDKKTAKELPGNRESVRWLRKGTSMYFMDALPSYMTKSWSSLGKI